MISEIKKNKQLKFWNIQIFNFFFSVSVSFFLIEIFFFGLLKDSNVIKLLIEKSTCDTIKSLKRKKKKKIVFVCGAYENKKDWRHA